MLRDALVVGVSSYQYLPALSAPAQDAEAIAHQLETYGDFRVTRLPEIVQSEKLRVGVKTPVTLAALESALVKLFKPKGDNVPHTALFYFSGHGLQKEAGIYEGYLASSDANPSAHFYGLSLFWLRRLLQESLVRQRIILLDCCHSGEILNFLEADPGAKSGTDRLFMAASREYESAYESLNGKYSVFTQALLDGLDSRRLPSGSVTNYALTDWVSNALKGELQQPLFENSGGEIVLTRCQNPIAVLHTSPVQDICPYRGLQPFEEGHAEYFFGREHLTDHLLDKLRTGNFLAVVGASGSGKSSLVRAGLTHKLQRGQILSGSHHWQIQFMTPTDQPFTSLANAFVTEATPVERAEQLRRAEMLLKEGAAGLTHLIRASLMPHKNTRLVLIIDQFEEVFTLCQGVHSEHDRHRFFNCLLAAQREVGDRFNLVIVLRADFFSKCSFYTELAERIEHNLVMVTPLSYDQIKASILKPAEKVGLVCEPNLVYNILLDIVGAPGELPLLQYTLLELWHRRLQAPDGGAARLTLDAYTDLGGVRGTLQKRADEILYSLSHEEQRVAKRIFIALTQLGEGTEDTRRRVLKSELVTPQFSASLVEQVLEKLVLAKLVVMNQVAPVSGQQEQIDQRFANVSTALRLAQVMRKAAPVSGSAGLNRSLPHLQSTLTRSYNLNVNRLSHAANLESVHVSDSCHETVDIAHEALIRNWTLLRSWLDENREMLRRLRQIERTAREWKLADKPRDREYLLGGNRLIDAEDFLNHYPDELSALAQQYITTSREETCRTKREFRLLQVSVPCTLMLALGVTFVQYQTATNSQAEKDFQHEVATSRQWSAIAQSVLQEPNGDPTAALLVSRLAAERGRTSEAEASLRLALQTLHLQTALSSANRPIRQIAFSPNADQLAAIDQDGTVHLWSVTRSRVERVWRWDGAANGTAANARSASFAAIQFSRDGKYLIAVANQSMQVRIWSIESGKLRQQLGGFQTAIAQMVVSRAGDLIAASSGSTVKIWHLPTGTLRAEMAAPETIQRLTFSHDGSRLLMAGGRSVTLMSVAQPQRKQMFPQSERISEVAYSPDDRWIAIANHQGKTQLWNANTGKLHQILSSPNKSSSDSMLAIVRMIFSPDGRRIALINSLSQVQVVQLESGQRWQMEPSFNRDSNTEKPEAAIAFSPDSQQLVAVGYRGTLASNHSASIRDAATGQELSSLQGHSSPINAVQFNDDGSLIATASTDGSVYLWSAELGGELRSMKMAQQPIQWASFQSVDSSPLALLNSPASAQIPKILALGQNGAIQRWQLTQQTTAPEASVAAGAEPPSVLSNAMQIFNQLQQMGRQFWSVGIDSTKLPVDGSAPNPDSPPAADDRSTIAAKLPEAIAISQFSARVQPIQMAVQSAAQTMANVRLSGVAASDDGMLFAIADSLGVVELWQLQPDQSVSRVRRLQDSIAKSSSNRSMSGRSLNSSIHYLAFSRDRRKLLGVGVDKTLRVWDITSGQLLHQLSGHEALVEQAHFSSDGNQIVSASWDHTARLWDVASGRLVAKLTHADVITSAQFSPDRQRVLITSLDSSAKIIEAATGIIQVILAGHQGAVLGGEFSPDGQQVVTASADGTARLWDANTGVERTILRPVRVNNTPEPIKRAFFSADGQYVATLSRSGTLHVWAATWQKLLELSRDRSLRQLKPEECLRYLRLAPNACPSLTLRNAG